MKNLILIIGLAYMSINNHISAQIIPSKDSVHTHLDSIPVPPELAKDTLYKGDAGWCISGYFRSMKNVRYAIQINNLDLAYLGVQDAKMFMKKLESLDPKYNTQPMKTETDNWLEYIHKRKKQKENSSH